MRRILFVEDEPAFAVGMIDRLESEGYTVEWAQTGPAGYDAAMAGQFDLIVLDIMLPDINGKEVCQRVRADDTLEQVKIICISGMVEQDKVADLRAAGADDFMQKPFTVDKLVDRACELLEMEKAILA